MKILLATTVAAILLVALPTELQGAPQITSEEMGRVVEEVKQMLASELNAAKAAQFQDAKHLNSYAQRGPYQESQARLNSHAQYWGPYKESQVTAQVQGVNIRNCGVAGNIINSALAVLNIFSNDFGVLVDCRESGNCVRVRVDVPANDPKADVRVCDLGELLKDTYNGCIDCRSIHATERLSLILYVQAEDKLVWRCWPSQARTVLVSRYLSQFLS